MNCLAVLGRLLYAAIFLISVPDLFEPRTIEFAASLGVPLAWIAVPLSGVIALSGGLSILLGYRAKCGAWFIVLFLVPVTIMVHNFWGIQDPGTAMVQRIQFMKNLSMLGAAFMIAYFGSGPMSLDSMINRRYHDRHATKIIDLTSKRSK